MTKALFFLPLLAFGSCARQEENPICLIPLSISHGIRLKEGTALLQQGVRIGQLGEPTFRDTFIYATIKLDDSYRLTTNSRLQLCTSLLGNVYINVDNGEGRVLGGTDTVLVKPCQALKGGLLDTTSVKLIDSLVRHTVRILRASSQR